MTVYSDLLIPLVFVSVLCLSTERALLRSRLEAMEQRALTAEQRLSDTQRQLQHEEQRTQHHEVVAQQARDSVSQAEERVIVAEQRADIMEERAAELQHRLVQAEAELEELAEYRALLASVQGFSLHQHGSEADICTGGNGGEGEEGPGQEQQEQQECVLHDLLRQGSLSGYLVAKTSTSDTARVEEERRSQCSDQISITSL